ncbi:hypothetical protein J6590_006810 [Homalodisca vitripennis]|nr:hypothetical protein J6590_006810 [Homalodisca vitripennis]
MLTITVQLRTLFYLKTKLRHLTPFIVNLNGKLRRGSSCSIVSLFKSLVRPLLEYGSVIWSPYQLNHKEQLQHVQNRFIRMLGPRLGFSYRTTPVSDVESHFGLLPLHLRRHHADLLSIDICVTRGLRSMTIFRRRLNTTNYSRFSGMWGGFNSSGFRPRFCTIVQKESDCSMRRYLMLGQSTPLIIVLVPPLQFMF